MIYLEAIELKFCGLDYELKENIDRRSTEDIIDGLDLTDNESEGKDIGLNKNEDIN